MLLCPVRVGTLSLAIFWGFAGSAVAQAPPAPSPPPPAPTQPAPAPPSPAISSPSLTVLVVDVQALLQNSKAAKMVRGQIEQKRNEYTKEISHQEDMRTRVSHAARAQRSSRQ